MTFSGSIDYSALYQDDDILPADLVVDPAAAGNVHLPESYVQDNWENEAVEQLNFEPEAEESETQAVVLDGDAKDDSQDARPKGRLLVLSDDQRKQRMRDQNRKAAEKSRNKRKHELNGIEAYVNETTAENARLRAKLALLRTASVQPAAAVVPADVYRPSGLKSKKPIVPSESSLGVDLPYLNKIANELASHKTLLLQRQLELARLKGEDQPESTELDEARARLLEADHDARIARAEETSIQLLLGSLQAERTAMSKTALTLAQQTEERKALAMAVRRDRLNGALGSVGGVDADVDGGRSGLRDETQGGELDVGGEKHGETEDDLTRDAVINEIRGFMEAHGQWNAE